MTAFLPILSYLVVGGFAGFFTAIYILGVGTWDGRSGGTFQPAAFMSNGKATHKRVAYVEVHLMWRWRHRWWTWKDENYKKITRAIAYLQGSASVPDETFWNDMKDMPEGGSKVPPAIIDAIKGGGALWELRAYEDKDLKGREYRATELSARVEVRPDSFPAEPEESQMTDEQKKRYEDRIEKGLPPWSPSVLEGIMREPAKKKGEIAFYLKEVLQLCYANPMLHEWLKPYLPPP